MTQLGSICPLQGAGDSLAFTGMTLRDWFAGQALAGLTASDSGDAIWNGWAAATAKAAYQMADAMLAERERGK